jgi:hypothetical protein
MSISTKGRITRKNPPKKVLTRTTYRDAWDCLALDFDSRCAYSMQHVYRAGGRKCMEVDHFNPHKKLRGIQEYNNLFPATRHCNLSKSDRWPSNKDRELGVRFLNCCQELDYDVHILEDPDTHEVVGVTPQGKYHVRNCDLNAPHLTRERAQRAKLWHLLESTPMTLKKGKSLPPEFQIIKTEVETMIPRILHLSGEFLEKRRALRREVEKFNPPAQ